MTILTIDVAFDWDSHGKDGYDGLALLGASGFHMAAAGHNPPGGAPGLTQSDQLQFQIYDISDDGVSRTLSDLEIAFQSAHAETTTDYPFADNVMGKPSHGWYPMANPSIGQMMRGGESGVFGGPFANWQITPRPLAIANAGWYFFRVSFKAAAGSTKRSFGNDPEMIIQPSG